MENTASNSALFCKRPLLLNSSSKRNTYRHAVPVHEGRICWTGSAHSNKLNLQGNKKRICQDGEESGLVWTYLVSDSCAGLQIPVALSLSCSMQLHLQLLGKSFFYLITTMCAICANVKRQWTAISTLICIWLGLLWLAWIILITYIISFIDLLGCYKSCCITCIPPGLSYKMIQLQLYSSWSWSADNWAHQEKHCKPWYSRQYCCPFSFLKTLCRNAVTPGLQRYQLFKAGDTHFLPGHQ